MFSIIIPVAPKDKKYLKRCLLSLIDQDYKEWEAIVVADGFELKNPTKDDRVTVATLPQKQGASAARNFGAKMAAGDYLLFFDADCTLFPGMLQRFFDIFRKKKEIDFIYGAYRFNVDSLNIFPSRPFDPYLLESMNYICTMSPMRKKVFKVTGKFRDIPYFQDWDFWIRAVKAGFNGHYIRDPLFMTEVPDGKSISGNQKVPFKEKIRTIEELNCLPKRNLVLTSLAAPYQAIERAKILGAKYIGAHPGTSLVQSPDQFDLEVDAVMLVGFFPQSIDDHMGMFLQGKKKIVCWIGTDVWQLRNKFSWTNIQLIKEKYLTQIDKQFCNSPELQEELAELGIEAEVLYQPLTEKIESSKLPKRKIVSAYFSQGHPLHNQELLYDVAKAIPEAEFMFYGTGLKEFKSGNITQVGWRPINEIIRKCRVHLRLTSHDGFPHTPIQHLMAGRRVVATFPLPFAEKVDVPTIHNWEEIKPKIVEKVRELLKEKEPLNVSEIREYYNNLTDQDTYIKKVYGSLNVKTKNKRSTANV